MRPRTPERVSCATSTSWRDQASSTPGPPAPGNAERPRGAMEVIASALRVLNVARPVPFPIEETAELNEASRLRYRYLDIRRPGMQRRLRLRHEVTRMVRSRLEAAGFIEVETPVLT